jgi:hypothetical protein
MIMTHERYALARRDWISAGSERSFGDHDPPRTQDLMKHPPVLWAYVTMKNILQVLISSTQHTSLRGRVVDLLERV